MKTKIITLLFIAFAAFSYAQENQKSAKSRVSQKQEVQYQYEFLAQQVIPMSMPIKEVAGDNYSIRFSEKEIVSDLPYIGTAHRAANLGRDKGMRFKGKPENYVVVPNPEQTTITASVKTDKDEYQISLTASASGFATVTINSRNRETITYRGELK